MPDHTSFTIHPQLVICHLIPFNRYSVSIHRVPGMIQKWVVPRFCILRTHKLIRGTKPSQMSWSGHHDHGNHTEIEQCTVGPRTEVTLLWGIRKACWGCGGDIGIWHVLGASQDMDNEERRRAFKTQRQHEKSLRGGQMQDIIGNHEKAGFAAQRKDTG